MWINFVCLLSVGALCSAAKPDVELVFNCVPESDMCIIRCYVTDMPLHATIHLSKTSSENGMFYEFSDKQPQYSFEEHRDSITIFFYTFYKKWEGHYTCTVKENTATHKTWTTDPVYLKSPINESNTTPPKIITVKEDYHQYLVESGRDVRLQCSVDGIPEPKVTWKKTGDEDFLSVGPVLHFPSITRENQGEYICVADNGIGKTNKTAKPIYVRYFKPTIEYANPTGDVITLRQNETKYDSHGEIYWDHKEMEVIVEGYSDPLVIWWKVTENGRERLAGKSIFLYRFYSYSEPIRNEENFYPDEGMKLNGLSISDITSTDLGTYVVTAENYLGTAELTFTMQLESN